MNAPQDMTSNSLASSLQREYQVHEGKVKIKMCIQSQLTKDNNKGSEEEVQVDCMTQNKQAGTD